MNRKGMKYKDPMFAPHEVLLGVWLCLGGTVCGIGVWQLVAAEGAAGWALLAIGVNVLGTACVYGLFHKLSDKVTREAQTQTRVLLEMLFKQEDERK